MVILVFVLASIIGVARSAGAVPVPVVDIADLVQRSDLIVSGAVTSIEEGGATFILASGRQVAAKRMVARLAIDRVVKGSIDVSTVAFDFVEPDEFIGYESVDWRYRLYFLARRGSTLELTDPYRPSLVAATASGPSTTVLGQVIQVVGAVLRTSSSASDEKMEAIHALWSIGESSGTSFLADALMDADITVRLTASAALLGRNDLAGLLVARDALLHPSLNVEAEALHNLRVGISQGIQQDAAVPVLRELLTDGDVATRRAASSGLRNLGTAAAVDALLIALDDPDREVRHNGAVGLAKAADRPEWGPSPEGFALDEETYLMNWREWAKSRRVK